MKFNVFSTYESLTKMTLRDPQRRLQGLTLVLSGSRTSAYMQWDRLLSKFPLKTTFAIIFYDSRANFTVS